MSTYLIGDIHGCFDELKLILSHVRFNPELDTLWLTGDLVARGPGSLEVLRLVRSFGYNLRMVLGNHDLHLLAVYAGIGRNKPDDRITALLDAPDADELIYWLRHQPVLQVDENKKLIMAHAGITPQWDLATARQCAREVEEVLRSDRYPLFLNAMYSHHMPKNWSSELSGLARFQFSISVFTRMRYCFSDGALEMNCKDAPEKAPAALHPWFELPSQLSTCYSIVFGHWASLMGHRKKTNIYGIDTGCCWGGKLTLLHWEEKAFTRVLSNLQHKTNI
ncbi:bis(5'-nucleosyl)-tetraphosphatase (symmetrical) ApaH [secondary endosymbiont of Ctenarytaina eucalypti]|uniref:Bis(5'-nucleosyl)-tetraphosphatase, symmetrical n=1 Tax=secondary endosymbiont of Ctenarytaina eucalypti TaxID=1199245 RepID=J3TXL2_9ENTR|nr:bis(5'-nucleosyl)-tetraphosphatase (symmetrical) ApaH [secondary endosymbiont of Ctenarytaina eucalypti]AFP84945.1 symmetrical bis(5'-nucleosyl)-tetraphosphatase [secondary endosymbiont of Ctenarytaina eucalypti]